MEDNVKVLQVDTSQAQANVDKLAKSVNEVSNKLNTGFSTAGKGMETFSQAAGKATMSTQTLQKSLGGVGGSLKGLQDMMPFLQSGMGAAASSMAALTKQALAFIATPLGVVIAAVGLAVKQLIDAFKRNEEAMTSLKKLMAPFQALWQSIQRVFDEVVKSLIGVMDKLNGANGSTNILSKSLNGLKVVLGIITGAFKVVERNVSAVFNVIGKLTDAAKNFAEKTPLKGFLQDLGSAFEKVRGAVVNFVNTVANSKLGKLLGWDIITDEIKNAVKATDELTESNQKIADLEKEIAEITRKNTTEIAENERKIAELREKASDKEKYNAEERKKFIQEAGDLEADNLEKTKNLRQKEYDLIRLKNSLTASGTKDLEAEANARAALTKAETDYNKKKKELTSQLNALNQEAVNAAKAKAKAEEEGAKAQEAADKAKTEEEKKKAEELLNIELEKNKRIEQSEQDRLNKEIEIEEARLKLYDKDTLAWEQQQTKIEGLKNKQIELATEAAEKSKELTNSFAQDIITNTSNWWDSLDSILKNTSDLEIQAQRLADEQTQLEAAHEQGLISEQQYQDSLTRIKKAAAQTQSDITKANANAQIAAGVQMVQGLLDVGKNISSLFADESEEAFEAQKAFEISSAVISTLMGAIGAYTGAASNPGLNAIPVVGPALAQAMGITNAAIVAAGGAAQIAEISKRKFGDKSTNVNSKIKSGSASNISSSAIGATIMQPTQYTQAVQGAQIEDKIGDTKVYVTETDISNTMKKVSVQETENRY